MNKVAGGHPLVCNQCQTVSMTTTKSYQPKIFGLLLLLAGLGACQSGPDLAAVESFANLRQLHVTFIDTYTAAPGKQWDDKTLQTDISRGEAMFNNATAGVTDQRRAQALNILHRQFQKDYAFLEQRAREGKPFFAAVMAQEKKQVVQENYDLAIKGELVRF
jgi:hypothetical protein